MDVHNTIEAIDCLGTLAECLREAKKDGHIDWLDLPKFAPMIAAARKAVDGGDQIRAELTELDEKETQQIVDRAFLALTSLADAVLSK